MNARVWRTAIDRGEYPMEHVSKRQRALRRLVAGIAAVGALMGRCEPAHAQIYEWLDHANNRHFASSLEQLPPEARANARLVVSAATREAGDEVPLPNAGASTEADRSTARTEEDDQGAGAFASGWDAGFDAGWGAGFRAAAEQQPVCPAEPAVIVLESRPPVVVNVPRYDSSNSYYGSPFAGGLTVPFDDGASRGLTRRQQIQDLRAAERGW